MASGEDQGFFDFPPQISEAPGPAPTTDLGFTGFDVDIDFGETSATVDHAARPSTDSSAPVAATETLPSVDGATKQVARDDSGAVWGSFDHAPGLDEFGFAALEQKPTPPQDPNSLGTAVPLPLPPSEAMGPGSGGPDGLPPRSSAFSGEGATVPSLPRAPSTGRAASAGIGTVLADATNTPSGAKPRCSSTSSQPRLATERVSGMGAPSTPATTRLAQTAPRLTAGTPAGDGAPAASPFHIPGGGSRGLMSMPGTASNVATMVPQPTECAHALKQMDLTLAGSEVATKLQQNDLHVFEADLRAIEEQYRALHAEIDTSAQTLARAFTEAARELAPHRDLGELLGQPDAPLPHLVPLLLAELRSFT